MTDRAVQSSPASTRRRTGEFPSPVSPYGELTPRHLLGIALIVAAAAVLLRMLGRVAWCKCGSYQIWSSDIVSLHNSQHLIDPYTFTHILHGIGFYALLWLLLRKWTTPITRGVVAISIEAVWEVIENTSAVIEHYRKSTISLGYYGDSIANSMGDIGACAVGYVFAMWAPSWISALGFFATELFLLWWIRDSLLLNIMMLIRPIEAIKTWQAG